MSHGYDATIEWVDGGKLRIGYPDGAEIFKQETNLASTEGIEISYFTLPATDGEFSSDKAGCMPNKPLQPIAPKDGAPAER